MEPAGAHRRGPPQLFGSPNAAAWPQGSTELESAHDVAGLREFLTGPFMQLPSSRPALVGPTMHVAALSASAATVTIMDAAGQPVAGADVAWSWAAGNASGQLACATQPAGYCSVTVELATKLGGASFSVIGVAKTPSPTTARRTRRRRRSPWRGPR